MLVETFLCLAREVLPLAPSRLEGSGVWRGSSKHKPRLRRPQRVPRDVGAVVTQTQCNGAALGPGKPFAMGWVKLGVGLEHFGHGKWGKQAATVLLVLFSPETCPGISQS